MKIQKKETFVNIRMYVYSLQTEKKISHVDCYVQFYEYTKPVANIYQSCLNFK